MIRKVGIFRPVLMLFTFIFFMHLFIPQIALSGDHGNSFETATNIFQGNMIQGIIVPQDDLDYFKFTVSEFGRFYLYTGGVLDTYGQLYDENLNRITEDDDDGQDDNFKMTMDLSPGVYYIVVTSDYSYYTGSYTLYLDGPSDHSSPFDDHGDTHYAPTSLVQGTPQEGQIDPQDDLDYFKFTVSEFGRFYLYTGGVLDTEGQVYDENLNRITEDDDDGQDDNFKMIMDLSPGVYYIVVTSDYSYYTGSYTLYLDGPSDHSPPFDDHGDTHYAPTTLSQGTPQEGQIDPQDDFDYYTFTVDKNGRFYLYTGGVLDTEGQVYDENLNRITEDDDDGQDDNFKVIMDLSPGVYYVVVTSDYSYYTGSYTLYLDGPSDHSPPFDDHGDTHYAPTPLWQGIPVEGRVGPQDDLDYFIFAVYEFERFYLYTNGMLDTYGQVFDENLNRITADDDDGSNDNFQMTLDLASGTYYVIVTSDNSYYTGSYTLYLDGPDADSDDDGIWDGLEDVNLNGVVDSGETDPCNPDTDGDGIPDGTELGYTLDNVGEDTDTSVFQPDLDPTTTTDPLNADTDGDGIPDGEEDKNQNGRVDSVETDPNSISDDNPNQAMPWLMLLLED